MVAKAPGLSQPSSNAMSMTLRPLARSSNARSKLTAAGIISLGELQIRIAAGGHWYRTLPTVGKAKAQRIAQHLVTLLPTAASLVRPLFAFTAIDFPALVSASTPARTSSRGLVETGPPRLLEVTSDAQAASAWTATRAGSAATAKAYQREATRLLLWLQHERRKSLAQMSVADCTSYLAFLQHVPARWISCESARPEKPGWAPFRSPLWHASHRQAVVIVDALFTCLQSA